MANLDDLLKQTLLFTSTPKPRVVGASFPVISLPSNRPDVHLSGEAVMRISREAAFSDPYGVAGSTLAPTLMEQEIEAMIHERKIWEYALDGLAGVKDLTVRHRTMGDMRMLVCQQVRWSDVRVTYRGRTISLPLENRFLLNTYFLAEGEIVESGEGFWQLPMNLDQSFLRVFGYQLMDGDLTPIPPSVAGSPSFMVAPSNAGKSATVSSGASRTLQVAPPLRVIVCVSLGCCKERNDFEPGGILGAARLIPHYMIMANLSVDSMEASVTMARAPTTPHTTMEGGKEEMTKDIGAAFFTDRNDIIPPIPAPYWDDLFDYYWIAPPSGTEIKAVRYDKNGSRESTATLIEALESHQKGWRPWNRELAYVARKISKYPHQGEFDNLHLAPRMKLPASVKLPAGWPRELVMAPFCVHDCLHTHWRWGHVYASSPKWTKGWLGDVPYRESGVPMVPPNQDVTIKILEPPGFKYSVRVHNPAAGRWQVVMHHGSAYALSYGEQANLMMGAEQTWDQALPGRKGDIGEWAHFYWHIRYRYVEKNDAPDHFLERLRWTAANLKAARDL